MRAYEVAALVSVPEDHVLGGILEWNNTILYFDLSSTGIKLEKLY